MKMTVTGLPEGAAPDEQQRLAEIEFVARADARGGLYVSEVGVRVNDEAELHFSGAYDTLTGNLSLFARQGQVHVFTGMCRSDEVAPYFAFRLRDGTFIQLYFEK